MAVPVSTLDGIADSLSLVTDVAGAAEPGRTIRASVVSSLTELSALDFVDSAVNLADGSGLTALTGQLPLPFARPVDIQVTWSVEDANGNVLTPDADFLATDGLAGMAVGLVIKPLIIPMRGRPLGEARANTATFTIRATVSLSVEGVTSKQVDLKVPVKLVPLEIPILLALFRHTDYSPFWDPDDSGFLLLVVPWDSPLQGFSVPLNDLLTKLDRLVAPLRELAGFAEFLTGLAVLQQALAAQPMVRTRRGGIKNLHNVHMRVDTFLGVDILNKDLRAHDAVSSLILLGPCGTRAACYDNEDYESDGEWVFHVLTGPEMITLVPRLHEDLPTSLPADRFFVLEEGGGASFGDNMSSTRFNPPQIHPDEEKVQCVPLQRERPEEPQGRLPDEG